MKKSVVVSLLSLSTLIVGCENHKVDAEKKIEAIDSSINAKVVSIPEFANRKWLTISRRKVETLLFQVRFIASCKATAIKSM